MISAYAQSRDQLNAMRLFQEMKENEVEVGIVTYNALLNCFAKAGNSQAALDLFESMKREDCTPNLISYNTLLTALSKVSYDHTISYIEVDQKYMIPVAKTFYVHQFQHFVKRKFIEFLFL